MLRFDRIIDDVTGDDEELQQMIAEETVNAEVARLIYEASWSFAFSLNRFCRIGFPRLCCETRTNRPRSDILVRQADGKARIVGT